MGIGSNFTNWVSNAKQGLSNSMGNAWEGLKSGASSTWEGTKGLAGKAWEGAKTAAVKTGQFIENNAEGIGMAATGLAAATLGPAAALGARKALNSFASALPEGRVSNVLARMSGGRGAYGDSPSSGGGAGGGTTSAINTETKKVNLAVGREGNGITSNEPPKAIKTEPHWDEGMVSGLFSHKMSGVPMGPPMGGGTIGPKSQKQYSGKYTHKSSGRRMVTRSQVKAAKAAPMLTRSKARALGIKL